MNVFAKKFARGQIGKGVFWTVPLWIMPAGTIVFFVIFAFRDEWLKLWYGNQLDPGLTHGDDYAWIFGFIPLSLFAIIAGYIIQGLLLIPHQKEKL